MNRYQNINIQISCEGCECLAADSTRPLNSFVIVKL